MKHLIQKQRLARELPYHQLTIRADREFDRILSSLPDREGAVSQAGAASQVQSLPEEGVWAKAEPERRNVFGTVAKWTLGFAALALVSAVGLHFLNSPEPKALPGVGGEVSSQAASPAASPAPLPTAEANPEDWAQEVARLYVDTWMDNQEHPLQNCRYDQLEVVESAEDGSAIVIALRMVFQTEDLNYWMAGNTKEGTGENAGCLTASRFVLAERNGAGWEIVENGTGPLSLAAVGYHHNWGESNGARTGVDCTSECPMGCDGTGAGHHGNGYQARTGVDCTSECPVGCDGTGARHHGNGYQARTGVDCTSECPMGCDGTGAGHHGNGYQARTGVDCTSECPMGCDGTGAGHHGNGYRGGNGGGNETATPTPTPEMLCDGYPVGGWISDGSGHQIPVYEVTPTPDDAVCSGYPTPDPNQYSGNGHHNAGHHGDQHH